MKKSYLNLLILGLALAILIVSGIYYSGQNLKIKMELISAADSHQVFGYDTLKFKIKNEENFPISPIFFVNNGIDKRSWPIVKGPEILKEKAEGLYLLESPVASAMVRGGQSFYLEIRDKLKGFSKNSPYFQLPPVNFPKIRNPQFYYWQYDLFKNIQKPFAWEVIGLEKKREFWWLKNARDGSLHLVLLKPNAKEGNWLMVGIWQIVDFPEKLKLVVKPMLSTPLSASPSFASGLEWGEERKKIRIVFNNEIRKPLLLKEARLYFFPAKIGQWNELEIDLKKVYGQMGWELPEKKLTKIEEEWVKIQPINLSLFLALSPDSEKERVEIYYRSLSAI